jgi:hypothetical protein
VNSAGELEIADDLVFDAEVVYRTHGGRLLEPV